MKYHLVALFTIFVWGFTFVSTKVLLVDHIPLMDPAFAFCSGSMHSLRHASPHLEAYRANG